MQTSTFPNLHEVWTSVAKVTPSNKGMHVFFYLSLICILLCSCEGLVTLHGSQQTRSPLVNWYLLEQKIEFKQASPRPNNHPFGQVPFLTDTDGNVEVFESGAILLYLADKYGGNNTPAQRASYTKWIVWANSELDALCFGESDRGMTGTKIDKPDRKMDVLENLMSKSDWLVDNKFSVADIAVASYLNYVPLFFGNVNPSGRKNMCKYMLRAAERPAFAAAFGDDHAELIRSKAKGWVEGKKGLW